ncbi:HU family DNA-binding protein [Candidatus Uhrbacteria bacterium]|jgi:DNA-binding protein HU-beta|nr:HU family DNA-binding protein [Candidatus Uhrbacteria bacterium]
MDEAKRLTKSQLMTAMSETWGVSKKEAIEQYDQLVELIYSEIRRAGEIMLPGMGKMAKKHRKARMGRNPATGETIQIKAKTVLKFSVNKAAKDALL